VFIAFKYTFSCRCHCRRYFTLLFCGRGLFSFRLASTSLIIGPSLDSSDVCNRLLVGSLMIVRRVSAMGVSSIDRRLGPTDRPSHAGHMQRPVDAVNAERV